MRTWKFLLACAALSLALPSTSAAQPVGTSMHFDGWSALTNQYVFRGLPQTNKGVMTQGGALIRADFYDDDWFRVSVPVGFFLHLNPKQPSEGVPNVPQAWYESRFDGGLILGFGDLSLDSRFRIYSSPNGSFEDVYELNFVLDYDDEAMWTGGDEGAFFRGFAPQVTLARELIGGRDGGVEGTFIGLGLRPGARLFDGGAIMSMDAFVPVEMGFSAGDYYEVADSAGGLKDQGFGYASVGVAVDLHLHLIPRRLGLWSSGWELDAVFPVAAGKAADRVTPDGTNVGNGVDDVYWVFSYWGRIAF